MHIFKKNLEAHEYIIGKTINFLAERIPQKESDPQIQKRIRVWINNKKIATILIKFYR